MGTEDVAKHFWATTEIGDETVTFIGLHLLAYPDDLERVVRREAQALIIQNLAKGFLDSGHEVVILGDVNDFDSVVCDAAENEPRSCVDRLFSDIDPDAEGDEMLNAAESIAQAERYNLLVRRESQRHRRWSGRAFHDRSHLRQPWSSQNHRRRSNRPRRLRSAHGVRSLAGDREFQSAVVGQHAAPRRMDQCDAALRLFRETHLIHNEIGIQVNDCEHDTRLNVSPIGESIDYDQPNIVFNAIVIEISNSQIS